MMINVSYLFRISVKILSLLIVGEAIALLVGMHFLSGRGNPWISFKNDLLLGLDIVMGAGLFYYAMVSQEISPSIVVFLALILELLTHGYRSWEYVMNFANKFCLNPPLFVVNNVKLAGLFLVFITVMILQVTRL